MPSQPAHLPSDESLRLRALRKLDILDTIPERQFDDIVSLASAICGVPVSLVSLIDGERQWFKARVGLDAQQTHRDHAFCAHAILRPDEVFEIPDTALDARFVGNDLVTGGPLIRFYAGAPVMSSDGHALGTVCVIDTVPRKLTAAQLEALQALARQTSALLELRELNLAKDRQAAELRQKMTEALSDDEGAHAGLRQRQRLASVGQLTSGIAHDFNNLLQTLTGSLQLMQRKAHNAADVTRLAGNAMRTVASGGKLSSQLLAFSRDQAPSDEPLCVAREVAGMGELLRRALGPEISLHFDLTAGTVHCRGDVTQLEAAVLNLVINARDAMGPEGSIAIATRQVALKDDGELPDGDYLALSVADTGPGMPEEVAQRAFEPFFSTKGEGRGSGLGLAQVYGFAVRAGGTARISAVAGEGTRVTLFLQVVSAAEDQLPVRPLVPPASRHPGTVEVLMVDDDAAFLDMMKELLEDAGFAVRSASSGAEALQAVRVDLPDVVLLDCAMQEMNGSALARELRAQWPGMPMVFLTGYAEVDPQMLSLEPDDVILRKPLPLDDVLDALARAIER